MRKRREVDAAGHAQDSKPGQDVIAGGPVARSRRSVLIATVIASVIAAGLTWHQFNHQIAPPRHHGVSPSAQRPTTSGSALRAPVPASAVQPARESLRPHARGSDLALRDLYRSFPVTVATDVRLPEGKAVFRVHHSPGSTGVGDYGAVAQARGAAGWVEVAHGDIGAGRVNATGSRVAFMVRLASLTGPRSAPVQFRHRNSRGSSRGCAPGSKPGWSWSCPRPDRDSPRGHRRPAAAREDG